MFEVGILAEPLSSIKQAIFTATPYPGKYMVIELNWRNCSQDRYAFEDLTWSVVVEWFIHLNFNQKVEGSNPNPASVEDNLKHSDWKSNTVGMAGEPQASGVYER